MSSGHAQKYVHLFEECQTRIQTLGELLLIPCKPHPVFTHKEDLATTNDNFVRFRDQVISHLNKMLILSRDVSSQIHANSFQWKAFQQPVNELTSTIVQLTQLSAHIAYLMALNICGTKPATLGPVTSKHRLVQADLELKFICSRLKHSRIEDLNSHILVDMCSMVTKCLSSMTEICRDAAGNIVDTSEQDQFKLCIKAITSTTGCLVSSVKSFKNAATDSHLQRVLSFCQPVISTSAALLTFATEEQFLGCPAVLDHEGNEMYKSVVGLAMSMVSACVQVTKAARDLVHDPKCDKLKDRISLCVESISKTASKFRDLLLSYEFIVAVEGKSNHTSVKYDDALNYSPEFSFSNERLRSLFLHNESESAVDGNDLSSSSFRTSQGNAPPSSPSSAACQTSHSKSMLSSNSKQHLSPSHPSGTPPGSHQETTSHISEQGVTTPVSLYPTISSSSSSPSSSSSSSSSSFSHTSTTAVAPQPIPLSPRNDDASSKKAIPLKSDSL